MRDATVKRGIAQYETQQKIEKEFHSDIEL
jgi:hypothetical protein